MEPHRYAIRHEDHTPLKEENELINGEAYFAYEMPKKNTTVTDRPHG